MKMKEKVVRPGGLELPTFWFATVRPILPNLARGVANRTDSASWGNSVQSAFSFFFRHLLRNCRYFPHLALHFRDSCRPFRRIHIDEYHVYQAPRQLVGGNSFHRHLGGVSVSDIRGLFICGPGLEREKPKGN